VSEKLKRLYVPKQGESFLPYLTLNTKLRQIDAKKLSSNLLSGQERKGLTVPTTGDISLLIRYKERDGVISSFGLSGSDLSLDQLQGAKQEGYRVTSSLNWVYFFADEILDIAKYTESGVERVVMQPVVAIEGFIDAADKAMRRYEEFAARLKMRFSEEEVLYVREVRS